MDIIVKEPDTGEEAYRNVVGRLLAAKEWRKEHWNGDERWAKYIQIFRGQQWDVQDIWSDSSADPKDKITVNITASTILNIVPFLMRRNPVFYVYARHKEEALNAKLQETALNYEWKHQHMQKEAKKAVFDSAVIGHGIIKTGFTFKVATPKNLKDEGNIEYNPYIMEEAPYIYRVNPFLFFFDPMSKDRTLNTSRWCAEIAYETVANIYANPEYSNKFKKELREGRVTTHSAKDLLRADIIRSELIKDKLEPTETQYVILQEIWDKKFEKYYLFGEGSLVPAVEKGWPYTYLAAGFPYVKLDYIPQNDELYGVGVVSQIIDQQYELNRIRSSMFDHIRRNNPKYLAEIGSIEGEQLKELEFGATGSVVFVKNINAFKPWEVAEIPDDKFKVQEVIKQDIRETSGEDELIRGGQLADRTTATEVNSRMQYFGAKLEDRVEQIDNFIEEIGSQILAHIKNGYESPRTMRVLGQDGVAWVTFSPDDIKAETDIEIESTSKPKADIAMDRDQLMKFYQILMQSQQVLQAEGVQINLYELLRELADKFNIKVFDKIVVPTKPNPMAQMAIAQGGTEQNPPLENAGGGAPNSGQDVTSAMMGAMMGGQGGGNAAPTQ